MISTSIYGWLVADTFLQCADNPLAGSAHTPEVATFALDQLGRVRWEKKGLMRRAQNFVTKELQARLHH